MVSTFTEDATIVNENPIQDFEDYIASLDFSRESTQTPFSEHDLNAGKKWQELGGDSFLPLKEAFKLLRENNLNLNNGLKIGDSQDDAAGEEGEYLNGRKVDFTKNQMSNFIIGANSVKKEELEKEPLTEVVEKGTNNYLTRVINLFSSK